MNLFNFLNKQRRFSFEAIPQATWLTCVYHCQREIEGEIIPSEGLDVMEWADGVILLLDGAMRAGHTPYEICKALETKLEINKARTWGTPDAHGVVEHVREAGTDG